MTAVACLRILLPESTELADPEATAQMVSRIGGAYLDSRWQWPRRWGAITPLAFGLADPRAERLDPVELQALSAELQRKLFGETGEGEVCMMALESNPDDILLFAAADADLLHEMIAKGGGAIFGHLNVITASKVTPLVTLDSRPPYPDKEPTLPSKAAPGGGPVEVIGADSVDTADGGFRGIYSASREMFVGGIIVSRPDPGAPLWSVADGLRDMPLGRTTDYDLAGLNAATLSLGEPGGTIFVPIDYSAIVYGSARRHYEPAISRLPTAQRRRLAAIIYETPRDPSWSAMTQVKSFLGPRFAFIDLQVTDPAFAIDKLPSDCGVTSVTFALPEGDEKVRVMAAKRFLADNEVFRKRRIWQAISNVRTRRELAACVTLRAPFVSGQAVTATLRAPPRLTRVPLNALPLRDGHPLPRPQTLAAG